MSFRFLQDIERKIMSDLERDTVLAADFMKNPKKVLNEKYSISIPDSVKVNVHQDNADELNIVLPPRNDEGPVGLW